MTERLNEILDEFINCLEVTVIEDSNIDTKIDLLKKRFQTAAKENAENISYTVANISLNLWNETLHCNLDLVYMVNVQELVYFALRSLIQPQFMSSDWLVIKTKIALSIGKKFLAFKDNCSFKEKAIQCFDYIEEIFYSQESVDCITIDCKVITLLSHIEALEDEPEKAKIITEELLNLLKDQIKPILPVAITFYNIGLKYYNNKYFSESVYWLLQSLDYGCNSDFHGQISSLLADAYLTWNGQLYWQQAEVILDAVDQKFLIDPFLRLRTYLVNPNCSMDRLSSQLHRCLQENCSIEQGIKIFECLIRRNYKELALEVMTNWITKHGNLANDGINLQKVFYYKLRLLLDDNRIEEMKLLTAEFLAIEDAKTSLSIMDIVEQVATDFLNQGNFLQAGEWFSHCIEIGNRLNSHNNESMNERLTNYYHQKCTCLIEQKEWKEAENVLAILTSSGRDYNCTVTQYLQLQICVGFDDEEGTIDALKQLCEEYSVLKDGYDVFKMIMMCIKLGISMSRFSTVVVILEFLNNKIDSCCTLTTIKLMQMLLKCKLATKNSFSSIENQIWLDKLGENIYDQFTNLKKREISIDDAKIKWFVQMFWNIAHSNKENHILMNILMQWSDNFLSLCHCSSPTIIKHRQMCLLLAITSGVEINRCCKNLDKLKIIADLIKKYKMLSDYDSEKPPEMANRHILLFELEAKIELQSSDVEEIFDKCFSISNADAKYYELLAAIGYKKNPLWSIDCIRVAIGKLQLQAQQDYKRVCQLYHSLVVFLINRVNSGEGEIGDLTIITYKIKNLLEEDPSAKNEFPQEEIAWLVTRCWNSGVQRLVYLNDPTEAHNCCMAAMKLGLQHLGVDYQRYLDKMNLAFPIMLKKNWSPY